MDFFFLLLFEANRNRAPARFSAKPQVVTLTQRSSLGKRQGVTGDGSPDEGEGPGIWDLRLSAFPRGIP